MPGPGLGDLLVALHPGVCGTATATARALLQGLQGALLRGPVTVATATETETAGTVAPMAAMEATAIIPLKAGTVPPPRPRPRELPLGINPWVHRVYRAHPPHLPHMVDTQVTVVTAPLVLLLEWAVPLLACLLRLRVLLPRAFLADSMRSSSSTPTPPRLRLLLPREMLLRRRLPWTCRLLRRFRVHTGSVATCCGVFCVRSWKCY
jgi:hypothetical protein